MSGSLRPRFGGEAAFLIVVAVVAGLLELTWPVIVAVMAVAWLIVAVVEVTSARPAVADDAAAAVEPSSPPEPLVARPLPSAPERDERTVPIFVEPAPEESEPEVPAAAPVLGEQAEVEEPVREPAAPGEAAAEPPAAIEPEPVREREPEPERKPEREPVISAPPLRAAPPPPPPAAVERGPAIGPTAAREWNLWELERRARERAGEDPVRDEEWTFLLMYLREFANADGYLPRDFDPLVRESFAELIRSTR